MILAKTAAIPTEHPSLLSDRPARSMTLRQLPRITIAWPQTLHMDVPAFLQDLLDSNVKVSTAEHHFGPRTKNGNRAHSLPRMRKACIRDVLRMSAL